MMLRIFLFIGITSYSGSALAQDKLAFAEKSESLPQELPELLQTVRTLGEGTVSGVYSDEKIRYKGFVKKSRLHGSWASRFQNENPFEEGTYNKGIPEGQWRIWHSNGRPRYLREFSSEKWQLMQQQWLRPHPRYMLYPLTEIYRKDPQTAIHFLKQNVSFPNYSSGAAYQPFFSEGLLHGTYINFDEEGKAVDSGSYAYGLRNGIWKEGISASELSWSGKYKNGYREGNWKCVNPYTKIVSLAFYEKGKVIWRKEYPGCDPSACSQPIPLGKYQQIMPAGIRNNAVEFFENPLIRIGR